MLVVQSACFIRMHHMHASFSLLTVWSFQCNDLFRLHLLQVFNWCVYLLSQSKMSVVACLCLILLETRCVCDRH